MASNIEAVKIPSDEKIIKASHINNLVEQIEEFVNVGISDSSMADPADHENVPMPTDASWLGARDDVAPDYTGDGTPMGYFSDGHTTDGYIDKKHIFKPEFYGAPAPRMEAVSGQIHHRATGASEKDTVIFSSSTTGGAWEAIPGAAARIKIRDQANVFVTASFFCFELGGVSFPKAITGDSDFGVYRGDQTPFGGQNRLAGTVALAVHGKDGITRDILQSTYRYVYTSLFSPRATEGPTEGESNFVDNGRLLFHMLGRHQHSIVKKIFLRPGIYDIGLAFKAEQNPGVLSSHCDLRHDERMGWGQVRQAKNIFFRAKNLNIDVVYNGRRSIENLGMEEWRYANEYDGQAI